jgi:formamidopyrimidine-DNA glycosylase
MPELPEVENFRCLLLPLISSDHPLQLERGTLDRKPPRKFISDEDIETLNQTQYCLHQVLRKGKLIAMVLQQNHPDNNNKDTTRTRSTTNRRYLMVHMGMTGRISTPDHVPQLESLSGNEYPPPHTYLKFTSGNDQEACFSDPRKFGSVELVDSLEAGGFDSLAPDAWADAMNDQSKPDVIEKLSNQSLGIKALLLDQKRVVCGVGNWIADEVLYQTQMHPDQTYLTKEQATILLETLHSILSTAVSCLVEKKEEFPKDWLFHYRWNKKKTTKDARGLVVTFVTSGGRTSAIVPSLQQKRGQAPAASATRKTNHAKKATTKKRARSDASNGEKVKDTKSTVKIKAERAVEE